ncbi:MAG: helix-turn-helix domain-containing protein [Sphingopyxis sp.]|nr:helix-turn-helix domain-containing protein [Sphingopyxis sp.]
MAESVRSLSQAFAILRLLADAMPMRLTEISVRSGISPSSCLNLLTTLTQEGPVARDRQSKTYRLAVEWADLPALRKDLTSRLIERTQPLIDELAASSDAAIGLWKIVSRERVQLIAQAETRGGVRLRLDEGQRQPLGSGAVGRAIAAAQMVEGSELEQRFAAVRWQIPFSFAEFEQQVVRARRYGYAIDRDITYRGISTVAVPMTDLPPGFSLSASLVSGSRNDAELALLGGDMLHLRNIICESG